MEVVSVRGVWGVRVLGCACACESCEREGHEVCVCESCGREGHEVCVCVNDVSMRGMRCACV